MIATASHYTGFVPLTPSESDRDRTAIAREVGERYRVESYIARGGFATVWHAVDLVENIDVAIKRIDPAVGRGRDFFRELRAMLLLNHANVVRLVNFMDGASSRFLILELCRGGSLRAAISRRRRKEEPWPHETANRLALELARGLEAAHAAGLTHRDLKPENVLFATTEAGSPVKLADFGLAGLFHDGSGALRSLTGSPSYMAPEQFAGSYQPASDLYALGVIAFELLTGELPFRGTAEELAYQHLQVSPEYGTLPEPWGELLPQLLQKASEDRPTAREVIRTLSNTPSATSRLPNRQPNGELRFEGVANSLHAVGDGYLMAFDDHLECVGSTGNRVRIDVRNAQRGGQTADGRYWVQTPKALHTWSNGTLAVVAERPNVADTWHAFSDERGLGILQASGSAVSLRRVGIEEPAWSIEIPCGELKRHVACHVDGTIAITDFDGQPGLQFRDRHGVLRERLPLPGIVWQLQSWSGQRRFIIRVLTGDGFTAYSTRTRGGLAPLPDGQSVANLAGGPLGIIAARSSGDIILWDARRKTMPTSIAKQAGETVRGVAMAHNSFGVYTVTDRQSILRIVQSPAFGGVR